MEKEKKTTLTCIFTHPEEEIRKDRSGRRKNKGGETNTGKLELSVTESQAEVMGEATQSHRQYSQQHRIEGKFKGKDMQCVRIYHVT